MIRIPLVIIRCTGRGGGGVSRAARASRIGGGGGARSAHGLIDKLQLRHINFDVVLAHAEKTTNPNDDTIDFTGLIDKDLVDVPELLILLVVNIEAFELGSAPYIAVNDSSFFACRRGRSIRRRGGRLSKRGQSQSACDQSAN